MLRITSADIESGRIRNIIFKLRKHPLAPQAPRPSLSSLQKTFAQVAGFGKYAELLSSAKQHGPAYTGQPLHLDQVIEFVGQRIARYLDLSLEDAMAIAAAIGLEHLDACRLTARIVPPSSRRDDFLRTAVHAANLEFAPLTGSDLISLGAPAFSYTIDSAGDTFVWNSLVDAVSQLQPSALEALKSDPKFSDIAEVSALRDAYVKDVLIPASHKTLLDAVREHELLPPGCEIISLFNGSGVFRGRSIINRQVRGMVPVISSDGGIYDAMASLLCNRQPQHGGVVRNLKPGDGNDRLIHFAKDGGMVVFGYNDAEQARHPGRTYIEYAGAEQMFSLAPGAMHREAEIGRLLSKGQPELIQASPDELVAINGLVLEDGRFPGDAMDVPAGPIIVDGQLRPRSVMTDHLSGPSFYERHITYVRLHEWLTVDDIPPLVLATMDTPKVTEERDHMMTEALPRYRLDLHYQMDESIMGATHQAQRFIASTAGIEQLLELARSFAKPDQLSVRVVQAYGAVMIQRCSVQQVESIGQMAKDAMPELEDYDDYVVGVSLAMSNPELSLKTPSVSNFRAKADLLTWLAIFSMQTHDGARLTARFSSQARALLISAILLDGMNPVDLISQGQELMVFLGKLADEASYISDVKKWRKESSQRWAAARKNNYWAVGEPVSSASTVEHTKEEPYQPAFRVVQESDNYYRLDSV